MEMRGSLVNRIMENTPFNGKIEVGTKLTECLYSDRLVYEVVGVKDQKHVEIRKMKAVPVGEPMTNQWKLESEPKNPVTSLVKRGKYWFRAVVVTLDDFLRHKDDVQFRVFLAHNNIDEAILRRRGKQTRYHRMNCAFGVADYYYDYSF